MLGYTIGIPLSILIFLVVGALVGNAGPDPASGLMPGLFAGGIVFGLCLFLQEKANKDLESPEAIEANCSPEKAFSKVYECLAASHYGPSYWSLMPFQNNLRIVGILKFEELGMGNGGTIDSVGRQLRLEVKCSTNAAGKTVVSLLYNVHSPQGRWTCDDGIIKTTSWIKRELMAA